MDVSKTGFWVFGYGSLVWQPGFSFAERRIARLEGYARSFCMWSIHHRGTPDLPGLVLALDAEPGGSCEGVAFRVRPEHAEETLAYLRERELVSSAYLEVERAVRFRDGAQARAIAYVVDPDHEQYCGGLSLDRQAEVIARAVGGRGPNTEYLWNVAEHLRDLGLGDADLDWLSDRVRALVQA